MPKLEYRYGALFKSGRLTAIEQPWLRCLQRIEQIFYRTLQFLERGRAVGGDQRLDTVVGLGDRFRNLRCRDMSGTHIWLQWWNLRIYWVRRVGPPEYFTSNLYANERDTRNLVLR